jgi:hypothetical protein
LLAPSPTRRRISENYQDRAFLAAPPTRVTARAGEPTGSRSAPLAGVLERPLNGDWPDARRESRRHPTLNGSTIPGDDTRATHAPRSRPARRTGHSCVATGASVSEVAAQVPALDSAERRHYVFADACFARTEAGVSTPSAETSQDRPEQASPAPRAETLPLVQITGAGADATPPLQPSRTHSRHYEARGNVSGSPGLGRHERCSCLLA